MLPTRGAWTSTPASRTASIRPTPTMYVVSVADSELVIRGFGHLGFCEVVYSGRAFISYGLKLRSVITQGQLTG